MSISIVQCIGCGAEILVWGASPSAICHSCEQQQLLPYRERQQEGLGKWIGGGLL